MADIRNCPETVNSAADARHASAADARHASHDSFDAQNDTPMTYCSSSGQYA